MKILILSTVAVAIIALSQGPTFASSNSSDQGFQIYLESVNRHHAAPAGQREFLSATVKERRPHAGTASKHRFLSGAIGDIDYDQGVSDHGKETAVFRAVQTWGR